MWDMLRDIYFRTLEFAAFAAVFSWLILFASGCMYASAWLWHATLGMAG